MERGSSLRSMSFLLFLHWSYGKGREDIGRREKMYVAIAGRM